MNEDSVTTRPGKSIDWRAVHRQVEAANQVLLEGAALSPEESCLVLRKRARLLARVMQQPDANQEFLEIIEFRLAAETYGIEAAFVREVYPLKEFTPLPGVPPFVLGIANVRGQILSIIDLKSFFDLPHKGLGQLNKLIILRDGQMEFGVLADDIARGTFGGGGGHAAGPGNNLRDWS